MSIKIISKQGACRLAYNLSKALNIKHLEIYIDRFANNEVKIQISDNLSDDIIILVYNFYDNVNLEIIELLFLINTLKLAQVKAIIAVIPYLPYTRADRFIKGRPLSSQVIAQCLENTGLDCLLTFNLHSTNIQYFFNNVIIKNLNALSLLSNKLNDIIQIDRNNYVIVSADLGASNMAYQLSSMLKISNIVYATKIRSNDNILQIIIDYDVSDKICIIIDDMIDTGGTILSNTDVLFQKGCKEVIVLAVHSLLSKNAVIEINNSKIQHVITTNSVEHSNLPSKFIVCDISQILSYNITKLIRYFSKV